MSVLKCWLMYIIWMGCMVCNYDVFASRDGKDMAKEQQLKRYFNLNLGVAIVKQSGILWDLNYHHDINPRFGATLGFQSYGTRAANLPDNYSRGFQIIRTSNPKDRHTFCYLLGTREK